jgi:hypothetical protein
MSAADFAAICGNNRNNDDMFGGNSAWWIIILLLFGWGRNGFGFGGNGGGCGEPCATQSDVRAAVDQQTLISKLDQQTYGLADSTYALNNTIMSGFHGVDSGLCNLQHSISDCCCTTQNAIQNVRYDMATQACDTRNLIQNVARDITDNANANTRSIMDFLVQDKISTLTAENQALKFAASQASQNAFITANQEAQTAELIRRLGRDCPVPAYVVPNPNCCYGNPLGVGYSGNYGGGCGCGCAA